MKRIKTLISGLFVALILPVLPSMAASSQWFETDGAKLRFVSETTPNNEGIINAALQIELEPGWKTYWREPGSTGIPPHIDFSQSKNLDHARVLFPAPVMIDDGYARYAGYKKSVTLPIELISNGEDLHLISDIFIGVCSDICVPFSANIDLNLSQLQTSAIEKEIIEIARLDLPREQGDDFKLKSARYDKQRHSIDLNISLPGFYPKSFEPEVFLHGPSEIPLSQPVLSKLDDTGAVFETKLFNEFKDGEKLSGDLYILLKLGQRSVQTTIKLNSLN